VYGSSAAIGRLFLNCDSVAELRRAKDLPGQFVTWSNVEQAEWATDLANRIVMPISDDVAVCILDSGVTHTHPLLASALALNDVQVYDPAWLLQDSRGHGTNMAGVALYGDLVSALESSAQIALTHRLESVKVLPDQGENVPKLYGAITRDAIAQAEISAANRRRAVCLAVTSDIDTNRGRPSSWSAAIDQLCFGEDEHKRLILISAETSVKASPGMIIQRETRLNRSKIRHRRGMRLPLARSRRRPPLSIPPSRVGSRLLR